MRSFKSEFHAGTGKNIIVFNVYVPSSKRRKAMTAQQKKDAREWAKDTLKHAKLMLADVCR